MPTSVLQVYFLTLLGGTSLAFDLGGENDVTQITDTIVPSFEKFDGLTQSINSPPDLSENLNGPEQLPDEHTDSSNQVWPLHISLQVGWPSISGDQGQLSWLSNLRGSEELTSSSKDYSGSGGEGPKNEQEWIPHIKEQEAKTLEGDHSDLNPNSLTTDTNFQFPASSAPENSVEVPDSTEIKSQIARDNSRKTDTLLTPTIHREQDVSLTPNIESLPTKSIDDTNEKPKSSFSKTGAFSDNDVTQQQSLLQSETTAGGDLIASMSVWGAPVVASTGTNLSSVEPHLGRITSKSGKCVVAKPTEYISDEYLDWVWQHRIGPTAPLKPNVNWNVMDNSNLLLDKFVHNEGSINYCVRWESNTNLDKQSASQFQGVLERHYNKWNKWLEGYNCWPFKKLNVNIVGWAARDKSQFKWADTTLGHIYEGIVDSSGVPQCPDECYRFYDSISNRWSDTSTCTNEPFDVSLWLSESISNGFGFDWGQQLSLNNTMEHLYDENIMFVGHEIGHGFGLPDFYGPETKPSDDFPNSIMMAYSSTTIMPSDGWMLRRVLDHVRNRFTF
ncbi:Metallopeptidase, catalytic domain [Plasmopara halstedii]|uniref:Metallopeptidase, catalytic domain n=1 Tax=Plasmopara halstedii TaxID=4781 RepID=A0A0N7L7H7_PLAHL|nr:Metallopeptidase, catalytic domain [Plasmopara halstedii]CEG47107.1 Metallopeptidase, catalytic domain [Plasmopara halstedii]|eukprot:XP_024583476.1 Metallopeptidase, catalytic domain [Plasmopara halstedii]